MNDSSFARYNDMLRKKNHDAAVTTKLTLTDNLPLTCSRSGNCCHGKTVRLNPWELACLAAAKGLTPREFRDRYCDFGGIHLRFDGAPGWRQQPACSQYVPDFGCSVHLGRPFAFLLESGLAELGDRQTLRLWREMGREEPEQLADRLGPEWIDLLMIPELTDGLNDPIAFSRRHHDLLLSKAQESFGTLDNITDFSKASELLMGLALHLGRGLGANPIELAEHWIKTAKEHGALDYRHPDGEPIGSWHIRNLFCKTLSPTNR